MSARAIAGKSAHFLVCQRQRLKLTPQKSCFLKTEVTLTDDHVIQKIDLQNRRGRGNARVSCRSAWERVASPDGRGRFAPQSRTKIKSVFFLRRK